MQVAPIEPTLKAPGTGRLTLKYDKLLSSFAFNFNLRRFIAVKQSEATHPVLHRWVQSQARLIRASGGLGDRGGGDRGAGGGEPGQPGAQSSSDDAEEAAAAAAAAMCLAEARALAASGDVW